MTFAKLTAACTSSADDDDDDDDDSDCDVGCCCFRAAVNDFGLTTITITMTCNNKY